MICGYMLRKNTRVYRSGAVVAVVAALVFGAFVLFWRIKQWNDSGGLKCSDFENDHALYRRCRELGACDRHTNNGEETGVRTMRHGNMFQIENITNDMCPCPCACDDPQEQVTFVDESDGTARTEFRTLSCESGESADSHQWRSERESFLVVFNLAIMMCIGPTAFVMMFMVARVCKCYYGRKIRRLTTLVRADTELKVQRQREETEEAQEQAQIEQAEQEERERDWENMRPMYIVDGMDLVTGSSSASTAAQHSVFHGGHEQSMHSSSAGSGCAPAPAVDTYRYTGEQNGVIATGNVLTYGDDEDDI
jgi:hypothetical protein